MADSVQPLAREELAEMVARIREYADEDTQGLDSEVWDVSKRMRMRLIATCEALYAEIDRPLSREMIFQAIKEAGLKNLYSCCNTELKCCNSDQWEGNLEGFAQAILRIVREVL